VRGLIGLVIALVARTAAASCHDLDAWSVLRGDLAPGATCGALVMTTDAGDARAYTGGEFWHFSVARAARRERVRVPYELSFEVDHLTPGQWRMQIAAAGVTIQITWRTVGFIFDSAQFANEFFEPHYELNAPGRHRLTVRQTASEVAVLYDGKLLEHRAVAAPADATIAIALLGAPGQRTRIALHDLRVR
jgi:hypothetical protein